jgi:DNA-directed RNA polymerase subunit H (RpoH/RPB5)
MIVFDRADHVLAVCEIKYIQIETSTEVIEEFEKKLRQLPKPKKDD